MHVRKVSRRLACGERFVYILIEQGKLRAVKLGVRGVRVVASSVDEYQRANMIDK